MQSRNQNEAQPTSSLLQSSSEGRLVYVGNRCQRVKKTTANEADGSTARRSPRALRPSGPARRRRPAGAGAAARPGGGPRLACEAARSTQCTARECRGSNRKLHCRSARRTTAGAAARQRRPRRGRRPRRPRSPPAAAAPRSLTHLREKNRETGGGATEWEESTKEPVTSSAPGCRGSSAPKALRISARRARSRIAATEAARCALGAAGGCATQVRRRGGGGGGGALAWACRGGLSSRGGAGSPTSGGGGREGCGCM